MNGISRNRLTSIVSGVAVVGCLLVAIRAVPQQLAPSADHAKPPAAEVGAKATNPLDAQRAYGYLLELCAIGPRPSGSAGMQKQQVLVEQFFKKAGGKLTMQRFRATNPLGGEDVPMANVVVQWHPE